MSDDKEREEEPVPLRTYKADSHTLRAGRVGYPIGGIRGFQWKHDAPAIVRDYKHIPATKTYGCKLQENKKGRSWLRKRRQYEAHVARNERRSTDYTKDATGCD